VHALRALIATLLRLLKHALCLQSNSMCFAHEACATRTYRYATMHSLRELAVPAFFQATSMSPDHTFLQQPKKVGKKCRSPARLLLRLLTKLSRSLLAVPDGEKLNWLSIPIDLQNLANNRRALSREKEKAQLRCPR